MKLTPTKVIHYALLFIAAYIVYSWLVKGGGRNTYENHPRNKDKFKGPKQVTEGHKYAKDVRHVKVDNDVDPRLNGEDENDENYEKFKDKDVNIEEERKEDIPEEILEDVKEEEEQVEQVEVKVKDTEEVKVEPNNELKLKKKEEDGVDILKKVNEAELRNDKDAHELLDHKLSDHEFVKIPKLKKEWHEEHDDLETAEEKIVRRRKFFEKVKSFEVENMEQEDIHIHEGNDDFPFVTAANSELFESCIAFIHSVQLNYAGYRIGIFNIGLSSEEVEYLSTICNVEVFADFTSIFPKFMTENMSQKLWRPIILQLALANYGHFVYLDPKRILKRGANLRGHFALSRKGGVAISGKLKSYSTAIVTHPEMYYYLAINVRKLLRLQHVELNMIVMHNSYHLQHFFNRWFISCAQEPYCIAPPGSKRKCDQNLYPKSHRYADCHRYDESAINILLASWHNYDFDHYAAADFVTTNYDGRDFRPYLKFCDKKDKRQREL